MPFQSLHKLPPIMMIASEGAFNWLKKLQIANFNYDVGNTLQELNRRFSAGVPKLILVDFAMSESRLNEIRDFLNDFNAFEKAHVIALVPTVVSIFNSADNHEGIIDQAFQFGCHDFLLDSTEVMVIAEKLRFAHKSRLQSEERLKRLEDQRDRAVVGGAIWIYDPETGMVHVSYALREMMGLGPAYRLLAFEDFLKEFPDNVHDQINTAVSHAILSQKNTHINANHFGERELVVDHIIELATDTFGAKPRVKGVIVPQEDVLVDQYHLYAKDRLTGLPITDLLLARANVAINKAGQNNDKSIGLLLFDIDHFKKIEATYGTIKTDTLLNNISLRLQNTLDNFNSEHDINANDNISFYLASTGRDEFSVLLVGYDRSLMLSLSQKLSNVMATSFNIDGRDLFLTASIGMHCDPDLASSAEEFLNQTRFALQEAKIDKYQNYHFYSPAMESNVAAQLKLHEDLRLALHRDELLVYYQPQVSISDNKIVGVEALVRWNHPEYGMVGPNIFIPAAEQIGLVNDISYMVLEQAIQHLNDIEEKTGQKLQISFNASSLLLTEPALKLRLLAILAKHDCAPNQITIEITETSVMTNLEKSIEVMTDLRNAGIRMALDDFGTGYSSLGYLKNLPFDYLKIDQSFIIDLLLNETDQSMVRSIIDIATNLNMTVLAEGVEHVEQISWLGSEGCHLYQGYYCSKPLAHDELYKKVSTWSSSVKEVMLGS